MRQPTPGLPVCALEAVDDTCASALTKAPVVSHLASRALLPSPGGGLTAPPLPWVAHFRPPVDPSLAQLAISRT